MSIFDFNGTSLNELRDRVRGNDPNRAPREFDPPRPEGIAIRLPVEIRPNGQGNEAGW